MKCKICGNKFSLDFDNETNEELENNSLCLSCSYWNSISPVEGKTFFINGVMLEVVDFEMPGCLNDLYLKTYEDAPSYYFFKYMMDFGFVPQQFSHVYPNNARFVDKWEFENFSKDDVELEPVELGPDEDGERIQVGFGIFFNTKSRIVEVEHIRCPSCLGVGVTETTELCPNDGKRIMKVKGYCTRCGTRDRNNHVKTKKVIICKRCHGNRKVSPGLSGNIYLKDIQSYVDFRFDVFDGDNQSFSEMATKILPNKRIAHLTAQFELSVQEIKNVICQGNHGIPINEICDNEMKLRKINVVLTNDRMTFVSFIG